jgi:hypothetical protein
MVPTTHSPLRFKQPVHVNLPLVVPPLLEPLPLAPLEPFPDDPLPPPPESVKKEPAASLLPASNTPSEPLPLPPPFCGKFEPPVSLPQADSGARTGESSTRVAQPRLEICIACLTGLF